MTAVDVSQLLTDAITEALDKRFGWTKMAQLIRPSTVAEYAAHDERLARLRAQQAGAALLAMIQPHEDHAWRQVGRCVYCECGQRLYQGTVPEGHPTFTPPRKPNDADRMRDRWGK